MTHFAWLNEKVLVDTNKNYKGLEHCPWVMTSNWKESTENNSKKIFSNKRDADFLSYVTRSEAESLLEQI